MSKPEVAIVGIGIHPFGRTPERTGQEQGVYAVREALKDAGVEWSDVQFAFGGSQAAGAADTMVSKLGLTGLQFINVANAIAIIVIDIIRGIAPIRTIMAVHIAIVFG